MEKLLLGDSIINQFAQIIPIVLFIGLVYIIFRINYTKKKNIKFNYKQEIVYLIFVCYITDLLNLVLLPQNFWINVWQYIYYGFSENPFEGMFEFEYNVIPILYKIISGQYILGNWVKTMLFLNILMFVPMGALLPICFKRINSKNIFIYAFLIPFIVEIIQPIFGRSFDIDDLITNFLGIIIGYFMYILFIKIFKVKK